VEQIVDRGIEYGMMKETTHGRRGWLTIMVCLREITKETSEEGVAEGDGSGGVDDRYYCERNLRGTNIGQGGSGGFHHELDLQSDNAGFGSLSGLKIAWLRSIVSQQVSVFTSFSF
jgi:hypothetical protein